MPPNGSGSPPPLHASETSRAAPTIAAALRLPFVPPLPWPVLLAYFRARAISGVESVEGDAYRRTVLVDGEPGVIELAAGGHGHLLLRAHVAGQRVLDSVARRARRIFNLDAAVGAAAPVLRANPLLRSVLDSVPGIRPPGAWDPYEAGVRAIVGQQISVAGASTIMARIVARHGSQRCGPRRPGTRPHLPHPGPARRGRPRRRRSDLGPRRRPAQVCRGGRRGYGTARRRREPR